MDLLKDFKDEVDDEFINVVYKLEELIDIFLEDEYLDGKPVTPMIDNLRRKLEGSLISNSKLNRLQMFVDDINSNRYRVQCIFTWLDDGQDTLFTLKQLIKENCIATTIYKAE